MRDSGEGFDIIIMIVFFLMVVSTISDDNETVDNTNKIVKEQNCEHD